MWHQWAVLKSLLGPTGGGGPFPWRGTCSPLAENLKCLWRAFDSPLAAPPGLASPAPIRRWRMLSRSPLADAIPSTADDPPPLLADAISFADSHGLSQPEIERRNAYIHSPTRKILASACHLAPFFCDILSNQHDFNLDHGPRLRNPRITSQGYGMNKIRLRNHRMGNGHGHPNNHCQRT